MPTVRLVVRISASLWLRSLLPEHGFDFMSFWFFGGDFLFSINPITGRVEEKLPNPMEGMTDEQKELEAMKLVNMFDKLSRYHKCVYLKMS